MNEAAGLTCSICVAPNALFAKIGLELDQLNGLALLSHEDPSTRISGNATSRTPSGSNFASKTSNERMGPAPDAWVATAERHRVEHRPDDAGRDVYMIAGQHGERPVRAYSHDDAAAEPIIEREGLQIYHVVVDEWTPPEQVIEWIERPGYDE